MINVGVIGYGYWGPVLVRNFYEIEPTRAFMVADMDEARLELVRARYPTIQTATDADELINHPDIDAVAVATPVSTHYRLALKALRAGKHVLVEKPMTETPQEAEHLLEEAAKRNLVLFVDHSFVYTGAVRKIKELVDQGDLGVLRYFDSVRVNLGLFQHDVNVLWDLAVHDLSILDLLVDGQMRAVSATGMAHVKGQPENVAYLTCFYDNDFIAHIHANWLAPAKVRKCLIGGSDKMIIYDDLEPSEKVRVYDKGITLTDSPDTIYQMRIGYRTGDVWLPQLANTEALRVETSHFADCIANGTTPITGGEAGLRVVRTLDAADRSLRRKGMPVEV